MRGWWGAVVLCAAPIAAADAPHLISVSFAVPALDAWTAETVQRALDSPYEAFAVRLHSAYGVGPAPTVDAFGAAIERVRAAGGAGHVWPWIFLDRIIARSARAHPSAPKPEAEQEKAFAGMDLDGGGGALGPYLDLWRTALRVARRLEARGVVFDAEAYSDYSVYDLPKLATLRGADIDTVREQVRTIGAVMADIAAEEFPDVVILSLFCRFEQQSPFTGTMPALFDGLLQRALERDLKLLLVDGGETVGYCFRNLDTLKRTHDARAWRLADAVRDYQGRLALGGTIAPWADPDRRTGWMTEWASCKNSEFRGIDDFAPVFTELLRRYPYVWIYAAGAAPYDPLNPAHAAVYHPVLAASLAEARRLGPVSPATLIRYAPDQLESATSDLTAGEGWSVSGGPEAALTEPSADAPWVRFQVKVDQQRGSGNYPSGWLFLTRDLSGLDLDDAVMVSFEARFGQLGRLRVGLSTVDGAEPQWDDLSPRRLGQWETFTRPLALLRPTGAPIKALVFYVAESWYADGELLTFDVRNVRLLKPKPEAGGGR